MCYAIHLIRERNDSFELLATHRVRGPADKTFERARNLLWTYAAVDQTDCVLVRQLPDGKEVYRWYPRHAEKERRIAFSAE